MIAEPRTMVPGNNRERALLVGTPHAKTDGEISDSLDGLSRLAQTAGACVAKTMVQSLKRVDASLLIRKGKADEINAVIQSQPIDLIIFNDEFASITKAPSVICVTTNIDASGEVTLIFP